MCLTIIGIPLGGAIFKLPLPTLVPLDKTLVSIDRIPTGGTSGCGAPS